MAPPEHVVLVDEADRVVGSMEKMAAHAPPGHLHRALSVVVVDESGRILLQRRAPTKHHFAGLWSNTCCTHPRPGEDVVAAGVRRLHEEMGFAVDLTEVGEFVYRAEDPVSNLVEHELDHVLVGRSSGEPEPAPDPSEVGAWRWIERGALATEMSDQPSRFTPWLALVLQRMSL